MHNTLEISDTNISDLKLIQRNPISDSRGYLERLFCNQDTTNSEAIAQINHTLTVKKGVVRGMHFQTPPHAEIKYVTCIRGSIFDVAVDLRFGSPTFLRWHAEVLSEDNHRTLVIPKGFAHGFQTLTNDCEMLYFHTNAYVPSAEGALNALDTKLAIEWPSPITEQSERDLNHPFIKDDYVGIKI